MGIDPIIQKFDLPEAYTDPNVTVIEIDAVNDILSDMEEEPNE